MILPALQADWRPDGSIQDCSAGLSAQSHTYFLFYQILPKDDLFHLFASLLVCPLAECIGFCIKHVTHQ